MIAWIISSVREILVGAGVIVLGGLMVMAIRKIGMLDSNAKLGRERLHLKIDEKIGEVTIKFDAMDTKQNELNTSIACLQAQHSINHPGQ